MNNTLLFTLDEKRSLLFVSKDMPMEQVHSCYEIEMYWLDDKQKILIGINASGSLAYRFNYMLPLAIKQKLQLDGSIKKSLGYYWNEIFADRSSCVDLRYELHSQGSYSSWVGTDYFVSGTHYLAPKPHLSTWLYNDKNGDIILEVTPMFDWSGHEVPEQEEMDRYFAFLKNYEPVLRQVIPREVAQQWLEQTKKWYKIFYDNEQKECGK